MSYSKKENWFLRAGRYRRCEVCFGESNIAANNAVHFGCGLRLACILTH